jgi:hypothetical protein
VIRPIYRLENPAAGILDIGTKTIAGSLPSLISISEAIEEDTCRDA